MTILPPDPDLAEWLVDLLDRFHACGPDCPCILIEDNREVQKVRQRRGPQPDA